MTAAKLAAAEHEAALAAVTAAGERKLASASASEAGAAAEQEKLFSAAVADEVALEEVRAGHAATISEVKMLLSPRNDEH